MKHKLLKYFLLLFVTAAFFSCKKDNNPGSSTNLTLDAFISANPQLSLFGKALNKAGLESFKTGPGPFTWFAPTNDAFTAALVTEDSLNKMTNGEANFLMLYHLVNASLSSNDLVAVNSVSRNTQLGSANPVYFGSVNNETYINGSKLTSRDNLVSNGYVHIMSRLNVPPTLKGNLQNILTSTGQHTLFIQALTKTSLWTQFATTSIFTIFAPTDAAMIAAGYTSAAITAATGTTLTTLTTAMRYHYILNIRLFTNDMIRTSLAPTAAGTKFTITPSDNGTKIKGKTNISPANITKSDNLGRNGVVHIIDLVLKP